MSLERPRYAIDARQTRQRFVYENRKRTKIAAWQAFVNFFDLRLYEVEVV